MLTMWRRTPKGDPRLDRAAHQLREVLSMDVAHPLYALLHDAAILALRGKLRVSIDSLAFEIARTPALLKKWTNVHLAEDAIGAKITASLSEHFCEPKPVTPLWRELLEES